MIGTGGVTPPPVPPTTNWGAVWAMYAAGVACGAFVGKVPPALPEMRAELGLTLVESGFIATMINFLGALVGMLMGILCDRYGHKRLGLLGLFVMAAGGFLGAPPPGYPPPLLSRVLEGAGFILFAGPGAALVPAAGAPGRDRHPALGVWTPPMPTRAAPA